MADQRILSRLGITQVKDIKTYRSIYIIKTSSDSIKVLKELKLGALRAFLTGELLSQGATRSFLPHLARPASGKNYTYWKGNRYLLTELLPGREADYLRDEDLITAIKIDAEIPWFFKAGTTGAP